MSVVYMSHVCRIYCPGDDSCNRALSLVPGYRCTLVQRYLSREVAQPCPVHVRVVTSPPPFEKSLPLDLLASRYRRLGRRIRPRRLPTT
jgi:hypothetical protein